MASNEKLSEPEFRERAFLAIRSKIAEEETRAALHEFSVYTGAYSHPLICDGKYSVQRMADCLKYEIPHWYYRGDQLARNLSYGSPEWSNIHQRYTVFATNWRQNTQLRRAVLREAMEQRLLFFGRTMKVIDPTWIPDPNATIRL